MVPAVIPLLLVLPAVLIFGVPLNCSLIALTAGTLLYVFATTGLGLLMSSFTRTRIAAMFGTMIATIIPAVTPLKSASLPRNPRITDDVCSRLQSIYGMDTN